VAKDLLVRYRAPVATSRIRIRRGALRGLGSLTRAATSARRAVLVTDPKVGRLYGARARVALERAGIATATVTVPTGERAKSTAHLARLWERLAALQVGRHDALVALGGGVVGDLAGFAAATWLRGVPWIGVPTSLVAQVDSSIGGKTGVNLRAGKNLAGAFHQPSVVVVDPAVLATLPSRHLRAGLAEVVKTGMAVDAGLFAWIERHADSLSGRGAGALETVVTRTIAAKLRIVRRDEREREGGPRTALNFGHTLGHAIEAARSYRGVLHGEAVALGMRAAGRLSQQVAGLPARAGLRLEAVLDSLALPRRMPPARLSALLAHMASDKKRSARQVRWVLTPRVGHASLPRPIAPRLVRAVLIQLGARA
jgi:3-dehydroquinate synthase